MHTHVHTNTCRHTNTHIHTHTYTDGFWNFEKLLLSNKAEKRAGVVGQRGYQSGRGKGKEGEGVPMFCVYISIINRISSFLESCSGVQYKNNKLHLTYICIYLAQ